MSKFKELMDKKKSESKGKMEPIEAAARHSVLGGLVKSLDQDGMDKVKGLKKVTVASNDMHGLKSGLDKAKQIVGEGEKEIHGGDEHENDLLKHGLAESPEYQDDDSDEEDNDNPENHIGDAELKNKLSMHGAKGYAEGGMVEPSEEEEEHDEDPERVDYGNLPSNIKGSPVLDQAPDQGMHPDNSMMNLHRENEMLKKEIERLRAPKPFY